MRSTFIVVVGLILGGLVGVGTGYAVNSISETIVNKNKKASYSPCKCDPCKCVPCQCDNTNCYKGQ